MYTLEERTRAEELYVRYGKKAAEAVGSSCASLYRWKRELECERSAAMEGATIGELKVQRAKIRLLEPRRVDWQHLFGRNREGLFPERDRAHLT